MFYSHPNLAKRIPLVARQISLRSNITRRRRIELKKTRCKASGLFLVGEGGLRVRAPNKQSTGLFVSPAGDCRCPHLNLSFHIKIHPVGIRRGDFSGGRGWIRTTEAKTQQIYSLPPLATRELSHIQFALNGAGGRTRTPDLLITNQLLYQLSYTSI